MRFASWVLRQISDDKLPGFIKNELEQSKRNHGHTVMHEDIVPCTEGSVKGLEESCCQDKHDFSGDGEKHECIGDSLSNEREFSGFANEDVENLSNYHTIEVCTLPIFDGFRCVADRSVRSWGNLLNFALSPFNNRLEINIPIITSNTCKCS